MIFDKSLLSLTVIGLLWLGLAITGCESSAVSETDNTTDNSYCYVCHINYQEERLTVIHEKSGIGCENCHGPSYGHSTDEDGFIPPDVMFTKAKINPFCMDCHKTDDLIMTKDHEPLFVGTEEQSKWPCTKCHGSHRLEARTRRWDKDTGKLIASDGVSMYQQ